ncbi:MAG TPA: alpha/beta hydrolase [Longimicrobiales bacterium]|nr:alpha/beta hydrolase [Longimicrobiales bacterium]
MTEALLLLGAAALIAYVALGIVAWRFGDRLILPAPGASYRSASLDGLRTVRTSDGVDLAALHLPNPDARFTILYSHGNAEDLGNILPVLEEIHALGFAVFAYDYRGYGGSGGTPSVAGVLLDAEAVHEHVTRELAVAPERLILWGRSLGGGPSVHLAAQHRVAGIVLEATFTSAFCVVTSRRILPFDRLCNLELLAGIDVPLLFIHGRKDRVVPFAHGVRLHAKAREPKRHLWIDEAGHNDLWLAASDRIGVAVRQFADSLAPPRRRAVG